MTSFLRFFVLALIPLLAVTGSWGPALIYGLVATLLLVSGVALASVLPSEWKESTRLWSVVALNVVLVTLVDLVVGTLLPDLRQAWGLYLHWLALSPLVVLLPLERSTRSKDLGLALHVGVVLTALLGVTALVRELFGAGTLTLLPGVVWTVPLLHDVPLTILQTGAGGFFLAASLVVLYRTVRPQWLPWAAAVDAPEVHEVATAPPRPVAVETPETNEPVVRLPASADDWGEDLVAVVASLASTGSGRRRVLVIGSGNGELTYYLSMLCLDQAKLIPFDFRIRGVDHFAARIEVAAKGVYREHQIDFVPAALREAWMTKAQGDERQWRVNNAPRLHVQFEVADFQKGPLFFAQPCHLIVLNQSIEYVSDEKKKQLLQTITDNLLPGGALVTLGAFRREFLPEGMRRTGGNVFRKS